MQKKVLITGVTGFAGSHLAEYLEPQKEYQLFGTYLTDASLINVEKVKKRIQLTKIDLNDAKAVTRLIATIRPDFIFHLAALPSPLESFKNPSLFITNNITVQINLLEAIRLRKDIHSRILIVSSADVYGQVSAKDIPINEETRFMPTSPYAVSKIAQDYLGLQYVISYKLPIVRVRPFNHIGPRQSPCFVVAAFAKKVAEIEKGLLEPILPVGNLDALRDFTDVRDMVVAYVLAVMKGKEGEVYNIGSAKSYKIADILDKLLSLSSVSIRVKKDQSLFRPSDSPERRCDYSKFAMLTSWHPKIPIETTLQDTLDYWRDIV